MERRCSVLLWRREWTFLDFSILSNSKKPSLLFSFPFLTMWFVDRCERISLVAVESWIKWLSMVLNVDWILSRNATCFLMVLESPWRGNIYEQLYDVNTNCIRPANALRQRYCGCRVERKFCMRDNNQSSSITITGRWLRKWISAKLAASETARGLAPRRAATTFNDDDTCSMLRQK